MVVIDIDHFGIHENQFILKYAAGFVGFTTFRRVM